MPLRGDCYFGAWFPGRCPGLVCPAPAELMQENNMLDTAFIRENLEAVKANCDNRNIKADVDGVVRLDDERKRLVQEAQVQQQRANEVAKSTGKEKDRDKKQAL